MLAVSLFLSPSLTLSGLGVIFGVWAVVLRRWGMQDDVDKTRTVPMHRPRHSSKYTAIRPRRTYKFSEWTWYY